MSGAAHGARPTEAGTAGLAAAGEIRLAEAFWLGRRGGRLDQMRRWLTVLASAILACLLLAVATVLSLEGIDQVFTRWMPLRDPGTRVGVYLALVLLALPVLLLLAAVARIGSPERDRRIAAYRLAGVTPVGARRILTGEAVPPAAAGTALGALAFIPLHRWLEPGAAPAWWAVAGALALVPVLAVVTAWWGVRHIVHAPTSRVDATPRAPLLWPVAVFVGGMALLLAAYFWPVPLLSSPYGGVSTPMVLLAVATTLTPMWIGPGVARILGHLLARSDGAGRLLAGRRMQADPRTSGRLAGIIALAGIIGGAAAVLRPYFLVAVDSPSSGEDPWVADTATAFDMVTGALAVGVVLAALGLVVVTVESIVRRRRTLAAVIAHGTPRSVLARSVALEAVLPSLVLAVVGVASGATMMWILAVDEMVNSSEHPQSFAGLGFPWGAVLLTLEGIVAAALCAALASLAALRSATDISELRAAA
ncbi:FtsX-like permease family protein [Actinomycetota bacterium]